VRRERTLLAHGALLACLCLAAARADEPPASGGDPRALVLRALEDLRAADFEVRERARRALEAHAASAADLLEARRDDPDPEVRRTVRLLLAGLGREPVAPEPAPRSLSDVGVVTLALRAPPGEVLRRIGEPHGARFADAAELLAGPPIEVALERVPFFAAVAQVLEAAGLSARDPFDPAGRLVLEPRGDGERVPEAAAGPLLVRVREVTSTRGLGPEGKRRYALELEILWTPAVHLVTYRTPTGVAGEDPAGRRFTGPGGAANVTVYGVGVGQRRREVTLPLDPEDPAAEERLAALRFDLPVRLRHDRREVRFVLAGDLPRTLGETGAPAEEDAPGSVTLRRVHQPDGARGPWVVEASAVFPGETARQSLEAVLETAAGEHRHATAGGRSESADGRVDLVGRAYGWSDGPPVAVRVSWFTREEEGTLPFALADVPLR
jgi:hypothetical protein